MIKKFFSYYKPHKKLFIMDIIASFLVALCGLFFPQITKNIINNYVPNKDLEMLIVSCAILLAVYLLKACLTYFIQYWGHVLGVRMQSDMRKEMFLHLQKVPFKYYDENQTGNIMSRMINDLNEIAELAHHGPEDVFISIVSIIGGFIMMAMINLELTLLVFIFIPIMSIFGYKIRSGMINIFKKMREAIAMVNAAIEQSIAGVRVSKSYNSIEKDFTKFSNTNNEFVKARIKAYKKMADFFSGMGFIGDFLYLVVLLIGGLFFFYGNINVGEYAAFILYITMILSPLRILIAIYEQIQNGMTGFSRFVDIMNEPIEEDGVFSPSIPLKGSIKFINMSFSYDKEMSNDIFNNFNLSIEAGSTIALVGMSGAGKTTLCHLIPKFYKIDSGSIVIDNYDISDLTNSYLRSNIGIVAQDIFIIAGTIKENIHYGNLEARDEDIINAAKMAKLHDYIIDLKDGYDTHVGERGVKLSGGQKQRLSLARMFLKNPSILILDEATSALDYITEGLIQEQLNELSKDRTTIIVAHRLSTIKNADRILVLDKGNIIEDGSHKELLKLNGQYKKMYTQSTKNK